MLTSCCRTESLPEPDAAANPIGALGAACLGAGQVFMALAGAPLHAEPVEVSLFDRSTGAPGATKDGPALPDKPMELDALLVGCGAVMNGFAYAVKRLPVKGHARAVDRQRLRSENLGPYVLATLALRNTPKANVIALALAPAIEVTPYAEDFDPLFTVRLQRNHFPLPTIVIAGLDNVTTRHTVQRLWPATLIDMAAGGTTSQLILKRSPEQGMCLLEALCVPPGELADVERLALESGLRTESIVAMDTPVSEKDVRDAPPELREALAAAHRQKMLRCGFIRVRALDHEQETDDFAAATPFVVAYSGVLAAAELVKELMEISEPGAMRHQFSFVSCRGSTVSPAPRVDCECAPVASHDHRPATNVKAAR
jgi:molybdopterin/thiamine biosynthesis adenylyltransferase